MLLKALSEFLKQGEFLKTSKSKKYVIMVCCVDIFSRRQNQVVLLRSCDYRGFLFDVPIAMQLLVNCHPHGIDIACLCQKRIVANDFLAMGFGGQKMEQDTLTKGRSCIIPNCIERQMLDHCLPTLIAINLHVSIQQPQRASPKQFRLNCSM